MLSNIHYSNFKRVYRVVPKKSVCYALDRSKETRPQENVCAKHWTGQKRPVPKRMFVLSTGQVKRDPSSRKYSKSSCENLLLLKRLTFDESSFTVNFALEVTCKTNSLRQD